MIERITRDGESHRCPLCGQSKSEDRGPTLSGRRDLGTDRLAEVDKSFEAWEGLELDRGVMDQRGRGTAASMPEIERDYADPTPAETRAKQRRRSLRLRRTRQRKDRTLRALHLAADITLIATILITLS